MKQRELNTQWFDDIGENGKHIGNFSCYIAYVYAVNARLFSYINN